MHTKPVVFLIQWDDSQERQTRRSLAYVLENDLGLSVVTHGDISEFCHDQNSLALAKHGIAVAVLIENCAEECAKELLAVCSPPVFVLAEMSAQSYPEGIPVISFNKPEDYELMESLKASWRPVVDWIGANSIRERSIYYDNLAESYAHNYLDDDSERLLCPSDTNHQVVAQALRIKQCRGEMIADEYERSLSFKKLVSRWVEADEYYACLQKLRTLDRKAKDRLKYSIYSLNEGGIHDSSVYSYAYDPVTKEIYTTNRMGFHDAAVMMLSFHLGAIEHYQYRREGMWRDVSDRSCRLRMIRALIYTKLPGVEIPLLAYIRDGADTTREQMDEFIRHIYRERKYIPIDMEEKEGFVISHER